MAKTPTKKQIRDAIDKINNKQQVKELVVYSQEDIDQVVKNIKIARIKLLFKKPFFGNLIARMNIIENNTWCNTAATNGRDMYYNMGFFKDLTVDNIIFVMCHEVIHIAMDHCLRRGTRDHKIWNGAIDYYTNGIIVQENVGKVIKDFKMYHDEKYYGLSSEQIYDLIYDDEKNKSLDNLGKLLDDHIEWDKEDPDNPDRPVLTRDEVKRIMDDFQLDMIRAAHSAGMGETPGIIRDLIGDMTESKIPWNEVISAKIKSTIRQGTTYSKYNKKSGHLKTIIPGHDKGDIIDVAVILDQSGSIGDEETKEMMSEVKSILDQFAEYKLRIWCFDTSIHNYKEFTPHNKFEYVDYELKGGGGTDFCINWEYMVKHDIKPKTIIMMTDGYPCGDWCPDGMENYADTIFLIHGNTNIVAPFGTTLYYESLK